MKTKINKTKQIHSILSLTMGLIRKHFWEQRSNECD